MFTISFSEAWRDHQKLSDSTSVQLLLEIGSKKGDIVTWKASLAT